MTDNPSHTWLDEAQARCDAATEGPWAACERESESPNLFRSDGTVLAMFFWPAHAPEETRAAEILTYDTVEFAAHARTDLPRAISELRAAQAQVSDWTERCDLLGNGIVALRADAEKDAAQLAQYEQWLQAIAKTVEAGASSVPLPALVQKKVTQLTQERDDFSRALLDANSAKDQATDSWLAAKERIAALESSVAQAQQERDADARYAKDQYDALAARLEQLARRNEQHVVAYDELARDLARARVSLEEWLLADQSADTPKLIRELCAALFDNARQSSQKAEAPTGSEG